LRVSSPGNAFNKILLSRDWLSEINFLYFSHRTENLALYYDSSSFVSPSFCWSSYSLILSEFSSIGCSEVCGACLVRDFIDHVLLSGADCHMNSLSLSFLSVDLPGASYSGLFVTSTSIVIID
jgi:hypothetical protein